MTGTRRFPPLNVSMRSSSDALALTFTYSTRLPRRSKSSRAAIECAPQRLEMRGGSDAGVNQRRVGPIEQPRVVAAPGERTRVGGVNQRRMETRSRPPSSGRAIVEELLLVSTTVLR